MQQQQIRADLSLFCARLFRIAPRNAPFVCVITLRGVRRKKREMNLDISAAANSALLLSQ